MVLFTFLEDEKKKRIKEELAIRDINY